MVRTLRPLGSAATAGPNPSWSSSVSVDVSPCRRGSRAGSPCVFLQHDDVDSATSEQQPEDQAGRPATYGTDIDVDLRVVCQVSGCQPEDNGGRLVVDGEVHRLGDEAQPTFRVAARGQAGRARWSGNRSRQSCQPWTWLVRASSEPKRS